MSKIYISYSHKDLVFVQQLAGGLKALGQEVFYAHDSVTVGERWEHRLSAALREADAIIFILSESSVNSQYVTLEMGAALGYFEERGRPNPIPVVIDESPLPKQISHINALFARGRNAGDVALDIAQAVERVIGKAQAKAEKKQELRERVESNASTFIETSLRELRSRERQYKMLAYVWYGTAFLCLIVGLGLALWRATHLERHLGDWVSIVGFSAIGVVVLGLLIAVARFAFMLGRSFMVEALRNSDRIHAISFGEFYLKAFPEKVEWEHVKDAFQHWNIDKGSSFLAQSAGDFDPEIFKLAVAIAEVTKKHKNKPD